MNSFFGVNLVGENEGSNGMATKSYDNLRGFRMIILPLIIAGLVGIIFGLPHLLIPRVLGKGSSYTPFAVSDVSAVTYDETYIYAAQGNYTALRWLPAYDTDVFEYKDVPTVWPTIPYFAIAVVASVLGGTDRAFIACDFLLPALGFGLLFMLIFSMTGDVLLSMLGAVATVLLPFGPRNFIYSAGEIALTGGTSAIQPLEYSRLLHPQLSFTLLLGALLFLWGTLRGSGAIDATLGGVFGGLLFYCYAYYWVPWVGTCLLLLFLQPFFLTRTSRPPLVIVNLVTWGIGLFFWWNYFQAQRFPNHEWRLARIGIERGHFPNPEKLVYSLAYIALFAVLAVVFRAYVINGSSGRWRRLNTEILLFHVAVFISAIAAMNMEVVTGLNVEALEHYPNRLFQPYLCIVMFIFGGSAVLCYIERSPSWIRKGWKPAAYLAMVVLLAFGALRQIGVAMNTAPKHEYKEEHRLLFSWLNENTRIDDVLVGSDVEINYLIPVFTHNRPFVPNGTRSTASNEEIMHRFLMAMKLLGHSENTVRDILARDAGQGDQPLGHTYTYYLFQSSYGSINRRLPDNRIERILHDYRKIDLAHELRSVRADYVYVRKSENLQPIVGWIFTKSYANQYGTVWHFGKGL